MKGLFMLTDSETRVLLTEKGFKIGEYKSDGYYRKDRIIRNRPLPTWCINALREGSWVWVDSLNRENDYVKIRGKVVKPQNKTKVLSERKSVVINRTLCQQYKISYGEDDIVIGDISETQNVQVYEDFEKLCPCWTRKETVTNYVIVNKATMEAEFLRANPKPESTKQIVESIKLPDSREYVSVSLNDMKVSEKTTSVTEDTIESVWYRLDYKTEEYALSFEWKKFVNHYHEKHSQSEEVEKSIKEYKLLKTYEDRHYGPKYESNDGMRMESDLYIYEVKEFLIILTDGEEITWKQRNLVKVID